MSTPPALLTFGHGRLDADELAALVTRAGIESVVDIRRFPGSTHNPDAARGRIPEIMADAGVAYRWEERLGGRRTLTTAERAESPDTWWTVEAFRAYAAWSRSVDFRTALPGLVAEATARHTAIMCSEAVWWRCHRRLVSDVVVLERDLDVRHLMHDGRLVEHPVSDGARLREGGLVVWDGGGDSSDG